MAVKPVTKFQITTRLHSRDRHLLDIARGISMELTQTMTALEALSMAQPKRSEKGIKLHQMWKMWMARMKTALTIKMAPMTPLKISRKKTTRTRCSRTPKTVTIMKNISS